MAIKMITDLMMTIPYVMFQNDVCNAEEARNGTCYTAEECADKGGKKSGTCAEGFGVCCIFELDCDDTSSENNTYLVKKAFTAGDTMCEYKICKCDDDVCRIRLDFTVSSGLTQYHSTSAKSLA